MNVSEPLHDDSRNPCMCEHCQLARATKADLDRLVRRQESIQRNVKLRRLLRRSTPKLWRNP